MTSVRAARVDESPQVCAALAAAFVSDPVLLFLFPRPHNRDAACGGCSLSSSRTRCSLTAACSRPTTSAARASSFRRARQPWSCRSSGAFGFLRALGASLPRATRLQRFFEAHHISEPHYYIRYVGVAPPFQGQGLGAELLRSTLDRCDEEEVPAYLEASTERSAALYARLGFEHLGELQVPDGPRFWPMRRPPAAN